MAIKLQIRGDDAAAWAAANPILAEREIGFEQDTLRFKVGDGSTPWTSLQYIAFSQTALILIDLDGGGFQLNTGIYGDFVIPVNFTPLSWTLLAGKGVSGSLVVDIWVDGYGTFPPTVADTICGADKPTISSSDKGQNTNITLWTTPLLGGRIGRVNIDSCTSIIQAHLAIIGKPGV
jgi:hypothetical protein